MKDTYFKDYWDGRTYMSGCQLPRDSDGVVRNRVFVDCSFHPGCVAFIENCEFVNCEGHDKCDFVETGGSTP